MPRESSWWSCFCFNNVFELTQPSWRRMWEEDRGSIGLSVAFLGEGFRSMRYRSTRSDKTNIRAIPIESWPCVHSCSMVSISLQHVPPMHASHARNSRLHQRRFSRKERVRAFSVDALRATCFQILFEGEIFLLQLNCMFVRVRPYLSSCYAKYLRFWPLSCAQQNCCTRWH